MPELHAYRDGDFRVEAGHEVFVGPIYDVIYPVDYGSCATKELLEWARLGYRPREGDETARTEDGFRVRLLGEIPEWVQDRLKETNIRFELVKKRGPAVDVGIAPAKR